MIRRILSELTRVIKREIPEYLVRRNMMEANIKFTSRFKKAIRTLDVGLDKRLRISNRIIIVALGCVVDDSIVSRNHAIEQRRIADIPNDKLGPVAG